MQELIIGGAGIVAAITAGMWRLHRNQIDTESRITRLETGGEMLKQKLEKVEIDHQSLEDKVSTLTATVHQIDKNVTQIATQLGYLVDLLKNK